MTDPAAPPPSDLPAAEPSSPASSDSNGAGLDGFFAKLQGDTSGVLSLLVVLAVGVALAYILWVPFAQPTKIVNDIVGDKNCASKQPGTSEMRSSAATVAAWKMIGPMGIGVAVFVLRKRLAKWVAKLSASLHSGARPLMGPLLATLLFLLVWAGSHTTTGGETGFIPQKSFPAMIGVYTFAVVRYGPQIQRKMPGFFDKRERMPFAVRILITISIPTAVSLVITNQDRVSATAQKEQFVVLIGLALAYLMLSPKGGDIAGVAAKQGVSLWATEPSQPPPLPGAKP